MLARLKQVTSAFLALALLGSPAGAKEIGGLNGAQAMKSQSSVSFDELTTGMKGILDRAGELLQPAPEGPDPSLAGLRDDKPAASEPSAKKEEGGVITAKKIDAGTKEPAGKDAGGKEAAPAAEAKPAYKIYPSPYVPDDMPVTTTNAPTARVSTLTNENEEPEEQAAFPANAKASQIPPPVLTTPRARGASDADLPALPRPTPGLGTGQAGSPPIPTQFFPIFALGSSEDDLPQALPLASSQDLLDDHGDVTRAILYIHDLTRNAGDGIAMLSMLAGPSLDDRTLILAPQFPLAVDLARFSAYLPERGRMIARWPLGLGLDGNGIGSWQAGGDTMVGPGQKGISSFTALDMLLLYLADRQTFPKLQSIVIAGHGAGGDFAQRYAAVGQAPGLLSKQGIALRFLVANASSYLYFTQQRPSAGSASFAQADFKKCPGVNTYPYGLGELIPYARRVGLDEIRLNYAARPVTYLIGDKIVADPTLDTECAALAQGRDRLIRGHNYNRYLQMSFGEGVRAAQSFALVPSAGYDPVALFGSGCGMAVLFGNGVCTAAGR